MPGISVIICTYNPVENIFSKCLHAIAEASAVFPPVEILIIDNNSPQPLSGLSYITSFISIHPSASILKETKQGLTHARLRGIREAKGEILVFIDDDNVISNNFFMEVSKIAVTYSFIGAFSGQVFLSYKEDPPAWTKKYWGMLVYKKFSGVYWSNIPFNQDSIPCGAGLCVTREVAQYYLSLHDSGKRNFYLDRSKEGLLSGGDNDLAMCACDIGKGMGYFDTLTLQHMIPESRFTLSYLRKLAYGIYYSEKILKYMRLGIIEKPSYKKRLTSFLRTFFMKSNDGIINRACLRGAAAAIVTLQKNK